MPRLMLLRVQSGLPNSLLPSSQPVAEPHLGIFLEGLTTLERGQPGAPGPSTHFHFYYSPRGIGLPWWLSW